MTSENEHAPYTILVTLASGHSHAVFPYSTHHNVLA